METTFETLGARIHRVRKEKGLTQVFVCKHLHIDVSSLRRWESDEGQPNFYSAMDLANVFGVSLDYLAGLTEEPKIK